MAWAGWAGLAGVSGWGLKTDHWFYGLFQSAPDLIALLLPPGAFAAPELKAANHRLDGAFWPKNGEAGTPEQPVVLLEVQMFRDPCFQHRLAAQSFRFLQQHPHIEHVALVVITPHSRLRLGPARPPLPLALFW